MPRRALRKPKVPQDLSCLHTLTDLSPPFTVCRLFDRIDQKVPLELEIGSGKGLFLRNAAAANPGHDFVGIEVAPNYAAYSAHRLAVQGLTNARMICGDAARFLAEFVPEASLEAVHVYFPDPWWKQKHRKRRIMREEVLLLVHQRLTPGGKLHFWTDVKEYFDITLKLIAARATKAPFDGPHLHPEEEESRTHFERRTRLNGKPVYRAFFLKK